MGLSFQGMWERPVREEEKKPPGLENRQAGESKLPTQSRAAGMEHSEQPRGFDRRADSSPATMLPKAYRER